MIGAPCLAALGALRSGAGLARWRCPSRLSTPRSRSRPSATGTPIPVDAADRIIPAEAARILDEATTTSRAIVVGPGLGVSPETGALALQSIIQAECPVVIDADAITCLAHHPQLQRDFRATAVLTPHPGEFARLARSLGLPEDTTAESAQRLAAFLGAIVVLKGAITVVVDAVTAWEHAGNLPQLGTGGTGDVLAGAIAGLIAQHGNELGPFACAQHAVGAHADAARQWGAANDTTGGMLATDLLEFLPPAVHARRAKLH